MIYPPFRELIDKAGSRYGLVIAVSKRARQISKDDFNNDKPVSTAIGEIFTDKIIITNQG